MAPGQPVMEDIDSDEESDLGSDFSHTQTQLAVTDGALEGDDETNPLVSRIGGRVAWLPADSLPPPNVAQCKHCLQAMELLVQVFAPLDDSPFDRIVLVWGCARALCQKKGKGSIKAIRLLSHNARWAAKLEKKRLKEEAKKARKAELAKEQKVRQDEEEKRKKINPFSSASGHGLGGGGGLGGSIFGSDNTANPFGSHGNPFASSDPVRKDPEARDIDAKEDQAVAPSAEDESEDEEEEDTEGDMAEELAIKASIESSKKIWSEQDWSQLAPAYEPAQYLTTFAEPSSSTQTLAEQKKNKSQMQKLKQDGLQENRGWEAEKYESMMASGTDEIFERFVKRVSLHGKQIVRYEFDGVPLPFHAKGKAYDTIWPKKQSGSGGKTIVSGNAFASGQTTSSSGREYSTSNIPSCPKCGSKRVCEMQLMPNLVNVLRPKLLKGGDDGDQQSIKQDSEAERRREIEEALGHKLPVQPDADGITRDKIDQSTTDEQNGTLPRRTGLKWNTAFIFVCQKDCHQENEGKSSWSEEIVELQQEHEA